MVVVGKVLVVVMVEVVLGMVTVTVVVRVEVVGGRCPEEWW